MELRPGHQPQLVGEQPPGVVVDPEGLGLPARAVQRHDLQRPQALTQRMVGDQHIEGADGGGVVARRQERVDAVFLSAHAALLEPGAIEGGEGLVAELRQSLAAPE